MWSKSESNHAKVAIEAHFPRLRRMQRNDVHSAESLIPVREHGPLSPHIGSLHQREVIWTPSCFVAREGDGRVPVASASLENVQIRYVRGVHAGLPNMPEVYNDVFRCLDGKPMKLADTPAGALAAHLAPGEPKSEASTLDGTSRVTPFTDDAGLWELTPTDPTRLAELRAKSEAGLLPEFNLVRLL